VEAASLLSNPVFLDCLDAKQGGRKLSRNTCNSGHGILSPEGMNLYLGYVLKLFSGSKAVEFLLRNSVKELNANFPQVASP
jgi:hypothetical protein